MDNISFKSKIRLVPSAEFHRAAFVIGEKNFVKAPWTIKQSVLSNGAYTTDILDCTVCGLTDGQKVLLNHICPTHYANKDFNQIAEFIKSKIDLTNQFLQGFILGSKPNCSASPRSTTMFDNFVEFLQKYNIPFSEFKGGPYENNVAYSSLNDEWLISNKSINDKMKKNFKTPYPVLDSIFDKVQISEEDEIAW